MKLYMVECKGMTTSITGPPWGTAYVLAESPTEAYEKLKERLDSEKLGFSFDRVMHRVTLLAEEGKYPACRMQLIN